MEGILVGIKLHRFPFKCTHFDNCLVDVCLSQFGMLYTGTICFAISGSP